MIETMQDKATRRMLEFRALVLAHPDAEIAFFAMDQHGNSREAEVTHVELVGGDIQVEVG